MHNCFAVAVSGNDIYAGGYERIGITSNYFAKTWLNGQETKLNSGNGLSSISSIFIK